MSLTQSLISYKWNNKNVADSHKSGFLPSKEMISNPTATPAFPCTAFMFYGATYGHHKIGNN